MISFACTMAVELAPRGITINCLAPGVIVTDMFTETMNMSAQDAKSMFDELIPMGLTVTPEDYAAAAVFFASPAVR